MWFLKHFKATQGLFLFQSIAWSLSEADVTFYADTSFSGIGLWSLELHLGYYAQITNRAVDSKIFYYKAYAIVCAIHWASSHSPALKHVAIFSDNTNTVDIFNSMRAHADFNNLLKYAIDLLMTCDINI